MMYAKIKLRSIHSLTKLYISTADCETLSTKNSKAFRFRDLSNSIYPFASAIIQINTTKYYTIVLHSCSGAPSFGRTKKQNKKFSKTKTTRWEVIPYNNNKRNRVSILKHTYIELMMSPLEMSLCKYLWKTFSNKKYNLPVVI